jgi:flagellar FliJ protein
MGFNFSLAAVLRIRIIVEEREERALQKILFEITQTMQNIAAIDAAIANHNSSRRTEVFKPLVAGELNLSYKDVKSLKQSRVDLVGQIEKLDQLRERQLKIYEKARRDREMLTDMREDRRNVYEFDLAKREQKVLDDNYIARRGRS